MVLSSRIERVLIFVVLALLQGCGNPDLSRQEAYQQLADATNAVELSKIEYSDLLRLKVVGGRASQALMQAQSSSAWLYMIGDGGHEDFLEEFSTSIDTSEIKNWELARLLANANILSGMNWKVNRNKSWHELELHLIQNHKICHESRSTSGVCYAQLEMCSAGEVTGISGVETERIVEFTINCSPTPLGRTFGLSDYSKEGTAHFTLYDDGWRLMHDQTSLTSVNKGGKIQDRLLELAGSQTLPTWDIGQFQTLDMQTSDRDSEAFKIGGLLFHGVCAQCHGANGEGSVGSPNLVDDAWKWGGTTDQIYTSIAKGRRSVMPQFAGVLGDQGIKEVIAYLQKQSGKDYESALANAGQARFQQICMACHGPEGEGNVMLGAPNLVDDYWLYGSEPESLERILREGSYGVMPAFEHSFSSEYISLLTSYVQNL